MEPNRASVEEQLTSLYIKSAKQYEALTTLQGEYSRLCLMVEHHDQEIADLKTAVLRLQMGKANA